MKVYTMVARFGIKRTAISEQDTISLIDENYELIKQQASSIMQALKNKEVEITNLGIQNGVLVSTNGAIKNYPFINVITNTPENSKIITILNRVESNNKLVGYTVIDDSANIKELTVAEAIKLTNIYTISNGKVVDGIISSIRGNYPLRKLDVKKVPQANFIIKPLYISAYYDVKNISKRIPFAGMLLQCDNAVTLSKLYGKFGKEVNLISSELEKLGVNSSTIEGLQNKRIIGTSISMTVPLESFIHMVQMKECKVKFIRMYDYDTQLLVSAVEMKDKDIEHQVIKCITNEDKKLKIIGNGAIEIAEDEMVCSNTAKELAEYVVSKLNNKVI